MKFHSSQVISWTAHVIQYTEDDVCDVLQIHYMSFTEIFRFHRNKQLVYNDRMQDSMITFVRDHEFTTLYNFYFKKYLLFMR